MKQSTMMMEEEQFGTKVNALTVGDVHGDGMMA